MHFAEELVSPSSLQIPARTDMASRELQMATELIERLSRRWEPENYRDDYRHALLEVIEKKVASGGRTPAGKAPPQRSATKVIDLVSVLQESIKQAAKNRTPAQARRPTSRLKRAA